MSKTKEDMATLAIVLPDEATRPSDDLIGVAYRGTCELIPDILNAACEKDLDLDCLLASVAISAFLVGSLYGFRCAGGEVKEVVQ